MESIQLRLTRLSRPVRQLFLVLIPGFGGSHRKVIPERPVVDFSLACDAILMYLVSLLLKLQIHIDLLKVGRDSLIHLHYFVDYDGFPAI